MLLFALRAAQHLCTCVQAAIEQLSKLGQTACRAVHHTLQDLRVLFDMCKGKQASSITDCMLKPDLS